MLSEKLETALNQQINAEVFSAYLYFAMSAHFKALSLDGFGSWMQIQGIEELSHAKKFHDFILEKGGKVVLTALETPKSKWESPLQVFEDTLAHEQKISSLINNLVDLAADEKDHSTGIFLQWFVTEQVEEEASPAKIIDQLKLLKNHSGGIYILDKELSSRTINAAALFPGVFSVV